MLLDIPCVIFAGGRSSRMGEDKSLLPFGTFATLTQFQLDKFQKIFKNVYISCKDRSKFDFDAKFIEDIDMGDVFAPTIAFLSIFKNLDCESFFAISVDTPFVSKQSIYALVETDKQSRFATLASSINGIEPLCGIYHKSLVFAFEDMIKDQNHKLMLMLSGFDIKKVHFEDEMEFLNLNHKSEYDKALALLKVGYNF